MKRTLRWLVLERDAFTCRYCGRSAPHVELEVDHVRSRSNGGANTENNLVTACFDCNRGKGPWNSDGALDVRARVIELNHEADYFLREAVELKYRAQMLSQRVDLLVNEVAHLSEQVEGDVWDWLDTEVPA